MSFLETIRNSLTKQPIQVGFDKNEWKESFLKTNDSTEFDFKIYFTGLWVFNKLNKIRNIMNEYPLDRYQSEQIISSLFSISNRDYKLLNDYYTNEFLQSNSLENFLQRTVTNFGNGFEDFDGDDILETSIDMLKFPLKHFVTNKNKQNTKNIDEDIKEFFKFFKLYTALSQIYDSYEKVWLDCLWNDWECKRHKDIIFFIPNNVELESMRAVGVYDRIHNLCEKSLTLSKNRTDPILVESNNNYLNSKTLSLTRNKGRNKLKVIRRTQIYNKEQFHTNSAYRSFELDYCFYLLNEPLVKFENITLDEILKVWDILTDLVTQFLNKLKPDKGINKIKEFDTYSLKISKSKLMFGISKCLDLQESIIEKITACLLFTGKDKQELWNRPLIQIKNDIIILVTPLIAGNKLRISELFLKEGGFNLDKRGNFYEVVVRNELDYAIMKSKYKELYTVSLNDFKFKVGAIEEQIDLILVCGKVIVIGEIKCNLFPAGPIQNHNYYSDLLAASKQIKRKNEFLKKNLKKFICKINNDLKVNLREIELLPIVITNISKGVGFLFDSIPVTDVKNMSFYIKSGVINVSSSNITESNKQLVRLYQNIEEAQANFTSYIHNPTLISIYKSNLKKNFYPINKFLKNEKQILVYMERVEFPS